MYNPGSTIKFREGSGMIWARMLAYITGTVDQELLLRNEYLAAENRILRAQIQGRLLLSDAEKATLADIAPELEQRLRRHLKPTNKSWRVDETYVRVKGRWCYLYRAIDSRGATIDFLLSAFRDADAAGMPGQADLVG